MSNFLDFTLKRDEFNREEANSRSDLRFKKSDHLSESIFSSVFESIPTLMSQKMQRRFSRRLKYLLDQLEK
ncbi:MAG: hypothetical protein JRI95_09005 [Deltaproteobacteria bacterium]|nr:hypothetical protein [Deltaproteobacteria bacterium]MBW2086216.1 hypothetical protein [Deltaproteobacteria bacterium]